MNIGETIRSRRKSLGIKQKDFAVMIGISVNAICQIEIGNTYPNKRTLLVIAEKLGTSVAHLYFLSIEPSDLPEGKRQAYEIMKPALDSLFSEINQ